MTLHTGEILDGKYRIIRELGSGAMGAVYEGENVRIHRRVAIKVLLPGVGQKTSVVRRFEQEAQAAGRIGSEHIVEVLDLGTLHDGGFYMVMEYLEGETLSERIKRHGRLTPRDVAPVAQQLLFGLEMAHDARIVHRDLKPDNVFLVRDHAGQKDFVKILDFGISKFNPLSGDDSGMSMTKTGAVMGTPFYMAPEQAKGSKDVDHRSDLYSVGVILYEAITGQVPFHAGTFNELIFKIVLEAPPAPEAYVPDLDPAFSRIVRRAMARDPKERFQTASEFRETLSLWLHTGRDEVTPGITPPPLASTTDGGALDPSDGAATVMRGVQEPSTQLPAGTQMMESNGAATQLVDDGSADQASTRIVPPSDDGRPKPPPPPRRQGSASGQTGPGSTVMTPAQALPTAPMPAVGASPMAEVGQPGGQGAAMGSYPEEDVWPVAGVAPRRSRMWPILLGSFGALVVGGGLAIWLWASSEETEAPSDLAETELAEPVEEEEPAEADGEEVDDLDVDEEQEPDEDHEPTDDSAAAPPPSSAAPPSPPPVARPLPLPKPPPSPPPPPKSQPKPPPGRAIKTEL